jgi:hypothetical protein
MNKLSARINQREKEIRNIAQNNRELFIDEEALKQLLPLPTLSLLSQNQDLLVHNSVQVSGSVPFLLSVSSGAF